MKIKLTHIITPLLAIFAMVGCNIDDSYDLSKVDSSNVGFGSDDTSFEMPLFSITLPVSSLISSDAVSISTKSTSSTTAEELLNTLNQLSSLLPSDMSGEYEDGIDLSRLSDRSYVETIVADLFDELAQDNNKRIALIEMIRDDSNDYGSQITELKDGLDIDIETMSDTECAEKLGEALNNPDNAVSIANLEAQIVDLILAESSNITTDYDANESFGNIDIGDDVLTLLAENLDGDSNYLSIFADITTNLPLDIEVILAIQYTDIYGNSDSITISTSDDDDKMSGIIENIETLKSIISDLTIVATIKLNNYIPEDGSTYLEDKVISLKFTAYKNGSIKL